jgi:hypothetical protein
MNLRVLILTICFAALSGHALAQTEKLLVNKYWQYDHSHYDKNSKTVYTFKHIPVDSIKEIALYFEADGKFKEVTNQNHPKPARSGTWQMNNNTLVLDFPIQKWNYIISFIDGKEFQCTMSK